MYVSLTRKAVDFYKDKNPKPYYTTLFLKYHRQKSKGYIDFARIFESDDKSGKEDITQLNNYIKIKNLIEQDNLDEVYALRGLNSEFVQNVKDNQLAGEPNQKWHFLVSYCAQSELEGSRINIFDRRITCPELWLWLIEEAKDNNIIKDEDVEKVYQQAIMFRTEGNGFGKNEWKAFLDSYREKVKTIIMK